MINNKTPVITIDGPSGVGKGTVSLRLAKQLGWHTLDSGALYRALAWQAEQQKIAFTNEIALAELAQNTMVHFQALPDLTGLQVIWEQQDISSHLRTETCGAIASQIAQLPKVRQALLTQQRAFRQPPGLIAEGRDMGTIVFPDASIKIFLVADNQTRANRRYKQLKEKGVNVKLANLLTEIAQRDKRDSERAQAPLAVVEHSLVIDTTHLSIEEVVRRVKEVFEKHQAHSILKKSI
jgi:cytidylate kinase